MTVELTVCGLHVVRGDEPYAWQTGLYHEEVLDPGPGRDPDFAVAAEFSKMRVTQEGERNGLDATFFTASVHPGHIGRCAGFDFTGTTIDAMRDLDDDAQRYSEATAYTVCGLFLDNGQTYSGVWTAHGPLVACWGAFDQARSEGRPFLLACVHEGVQSGYDLPFAEPACRSAEEMTFWMRELGIPHG